MTVPLLISAADLRSRFFHGVTIRNARGEELSDTVFEFYIAAAQSQLTNYLGITLVPTTVVDESHAYNRLDFRQYAFLTLRKGPVMSVESVNIRWQGNNGPQIQFPVEWASWNPASYQPRLNLVPGATTYSGAMIMSGGLFLPMLARGVLSYVPDVFRVSYTAGMSVDDIDQDVILALGLMASIGPFNIAGDLIAGAGIASKSMSIPGLSQSISTTSSATNSGYGSRIGQYNEQLKSLLPQLRARFGSNITMAVC